MRSLNNVKQKLPRLLVLIGLTLAAIYIAWFAGKYVSNFLNQENSIIYGDYSSYINKKPALYVVKGCPACVRAKAYIAKYDLNIEIRDIGSNSEWARDLAKFNLSSVPVLIQSDKITIGFSESNYNTLKNQFGVK